MRILIVKMSSLGDIIHAFPVLSYIKHYVPESKIDWVVEKPFSELLNHHPLVNQVLCVETKKWRSQFFNKASWKEIFHFRKVLRQNEYDLVLDLQGNVKSGFVTMNAKSNSKIGFGYQSVAEWPNIFATNQRFNPPKGHNIREDYLYIVKKSLNCFKPYCCEGVQLKTSLEQKNLYFPLLIKCQQEKKIIVLICPGSNWANKQLSQETLKSFLQYFLGQFNAHFLFVWGTLSEKKYVVELAESFTEQSSVLDKLSLPALQNLMTEVDLILAMDSLPLHLAGTTSTPTYSFFGASSANKYKPIGLIHEAFQGSCPYNQKFEKRCQKLRTCKTGACIKNLDGSFLFDHFFKWWSSADIQSVKNRDTAKFFR